MIFSNLEALLGGVCATIVVYGLISFGKKKVSGTPSIGNVNPLPTYAPPPAPPGPPPVPYPAPIPTVVEAPAPYLAPVPVPPEPVLVPPPAPSSNLVVDASSMSVDNTPVPSPAPVPPPQPVSSPVPPPPPIVAPVPVIVTDPPEAWMDTVAESSLETLTPVTSDEFSAAGPTFMLGALQSGRFSMSAPSPFVDDHSLSDLLSNGGCSQQVRLLATVTFLLRHSPSFRASMETYANRHTRDHVAPWLKNECGL